MFNYSSLDWSELHGFLMKIFRDLFLPGIIRMATAALHFYM